MMKHFLEFSLKVKIIRKVIKILLQFVEKKGFFNHNLDWILTNDDHLDFRLDSISEKFFLWVIDSTKESLTIFVLGKVKQLDNSKPFLKNKTKNYSIFRFIA